MVNSNDPDLRRSAGTPPRRLGGGVPDLPHHDRWSVPAAIGALFLGVAVLFGAGCGSTPDTVLLSEPTREVGVGDWDDIPAAVDVAVGKCEMAVVRGPDKSAPDYGAVQQYELRTVTDEPARLIIRRRAADNGRGETGAVPLEIDAIVGRFGDAARERRLIDAVRRRLSQLVGVDFAPIR